MNRQSSEAFLKITGRPWCLVRLGNGNGTATRAGWVPRTETFRASNERMQHVLPSVTVQSIPHTIDLSFDS